MEIDLAFVWAGVIAFAVLAYVVLDGFDLGVGILFPLIEGEENKDLAMNTVAPVCAARAQKGSSRSSDSSTPGAHEPISTPARPSPSASSSAATSRSGCCRGTSPSPVNRAGSSATSAATPRLAACVIVRARSAPAQ